VCGSPGGRLQFSGGGSKTAWLTMQHTLYLKTHTVYYETSLPVTLAEQFIKISKEIFRMSARLYLHRTAEIHRAVLILYISIHGTKQFHDITMFRFSAQNFYTTTSRYISSVPQFVKKNSLLELSDNKNVLNVAVTDIHMFLTHQFLRQILPNHSQQHIKTPLTVLLVSHNWK